MQPDIDLRLRTMIKALAEVVLPALPPEQQMAREQGGVLLGSLELIRLQIDHAHRYEAIDLLALCELGQSLIPTATDRRSALQVAVEESRQFAKRWDVPTSTLRRANADLREMLCESIDASLAGGDGAIGRTVQALVLRHSDEQTLRERAFVAGAGWDMFPETLQSIDQSLTTAAAAAGTK